MIALLIEGCEFLVPSDPTPAPPVEANVLETVCDWWGLGTPAQNALAWAVRSGGTAYVSDLTALRGLAKDGLVVEVDGHWSATDAGWALLQEAAA